MPADVYVLSQQGEPAAQYPSYVLADKLTSWKATIIASGLRAKLFANDVVVTPATTLADLQEPTSPGYVPVTVSALQGPYVDANGNAYMTSAKATFTTTGGGDALCYGGMITQLLGAAATATFTEVDGEYTAPVITSPGSGYQVPPRITATGADGTGATFTAEITDGAVTAITITNPGIGYTTVTVAIEQPQKLIYAGNFPAPVPLNEADQAVEFVAQLDELAFAA